MNKPSKYALTAPVLALLGLLGLGLRTQLYRTCLEPSGLLAASPLEDWLTVLSLLAVALASLGTLAARFPQDAKDIYPASKAAAWATWASALAVLLGALSFLPGKDWSQWALGILGILSVPALIHGGWKRRRGHCPETYLQILVCLFFIGVLTYEFRLRGHDPQIQDYAFQVLALLSLSMAIFLRLCLDVQPDKELYLSFCVHCSLYFNLVALSCQTEPWLYAAGALWALGNLPREVRP